MKRITHLQVKVINLADEAKVIRRKENNALAGARKSNALGYDARKQYALYHSLNHHRRTIVRRAARVNQLALACLRGRAYARSEPRVRDRNAAKSAVNEAAKVARRFGASKDEASIWLEEAKAHLDGRTSVPEQAA